MKAYLLRTVEWVDDRIGFRELLQRNLTGYGIPKRSTGVLFCVGGLAFMLFLTQLITGILLLVHYVPTTAGAFHSVERIDLEVPFGWFIRGLHSYGATFMIVAVMVHGLRVFIFAEYKPPREFHWVTGMLLLFVTMALGFSGYLLPWTQLSYWACTVGTETLRGIPWLGDAIIELIRGGDVVGESTLHRFFALHVVVLPLGFMGLFAAHIYLVRRTGQGGPPTIKPGEPKLPFFPSHVAKEVLIFSLVLLAVALLVLYAPKHAHQPADPFNTPEHIKPEWYFLGSYQFLKVVKPLWLALLLQALFLVILVFWPFLDRSREKDLRKRPIVLILTTVVILALVGFTLWGALS